MAHLGIGVYGMPWGGGVLVHDLLRRVSCYIRGCHNCDINTCNTLILVFAVLCPAIILLFWWNGLMNIQGTDGVNTFGQPFSVLETIFGQKYGCLPDSVLFRRVFHVPKIRKSWITPPFLRLTTGCQQFWSAVLFQKPIVVQNEQNVDANPYFSLFWSVFHNPQHPKIASRPSISAIKLKQMVPTVSSWKMTPLWTI